MKYNLNLPRCRRLIDEAIQTFGLDLSGFDGSVTRCNSCSYYRKAW